MVRYYSNSSYYDYLQYLSLPIHLCVFLSVMFLVLGFTWYINYESMFEDLMDQFKIFLMVVPILLLLVVHWLSSEDRQCVPFSISLPERESLHRAGGSPWGVAAVLVFLLYMISYQSKLHESWFPIASRR
ncbi:uncharacterized protein LOC124922614 [Impatiens glandulifera]|uniref:uncharacterized protein LOC124922614 n=1 Tax=Impatiens glandulifera TaxID=253017 RepID=UPI001FB0D90C|nr:uncharacterized protein LOC124922614 [Impatiens glandulifera]